MAKVEIYVQNSQVYAESFKREFYISESSSGELFWYTGENPKSSGGIFKSWIQMADTTPRILTVLPDWVLIINGIMQESKFYDVVENLGNKLVELRHKEYRFIFNFIMENSDVEKLSKQVT
jgi:hypothetical protein